jgi:LysR family transcriptional regulator, hydrogen peroxide-inducible genes activator
MPAPAITLRQLYYFSELAGAGSFRRAAERAGVTQPSLSAQIQLLEAQLGHTLVERGATAILTPAGREVLARAQAILAEAHALKDAVQADPDGLSGTIRFGASPTTGPYLMPRVVKRLHRDHPELRLHVREGLPDDLIRDLLGGRHDVVLAQLPITGAGLVVRPLFREPLMLAMTGDDPLAAQAAVDPAALAGRELLALAPQYRLSDQIEAFGEMVGAHVLRDYEGTSLDAIRQMAGMGMGLALLPKLYLQSEVRADDDIVVRPLASRVPYRELGLVWRGAAGRAPAFERLAAIIVATASAE